MDRTTIDVGIDLGTTNSTIAVIDGVDARVIPNKNGSTITPSAVWIDGRGNVRVGDEAKKRALESDEQNAHAEFKLLMGGGEHVVLDFAESGRSMTPEELSAEVLKSLKVDFQSNTGEDLPTAVITVPAAFENPQTAATRRAAELAGLMDSPLLLEPVAASLAYGFQSEADNVHWFVYDFGGGTFDAAVMRIRDGLIQVVNHNGANDLGGKDIDWDIVMKILVPRLVERYDLPDFKLSNRTWWGALGRLKLLAEQAKIEVCRTRAPAEIHLEALCVDASGEPVLVEYDLTPDDVERISRPHIERSLHLCRKTLEDRDLKGSDMERVLMVGGSTLNPWVREAVEAQMGVPVEVGIDPVTVVARGAAIFAATQPIPGGVTKKPGTWHLETVHTPVGNVPDPDFGARVTAPDGQSVAGHTVELVDTKTGWRSGRITLGEEGTFMTQLFAEKSRRHEFAVELCDPTGNILPVSPATVSYTIGVVPPPNPPAANSVVVALRSGGVKSYIEKGTPLPARENHSHLTAVPLFAGDASSELQIPLLEGEHSRASRNHTIGVMTILGTDITRDVPVGSQLDITVTMDKSGLLKMYAYVNQLDQDFSVSFESRMGHASLEELREELQTQHDRLMSIRRRASNTGAVAAEEVVARIVNEQMVEHVEEAFERAENGGGALIELDRRVRSLAAALDDAEDSAEWPELVEEARSSLRETREIMEAYGELSDRNRLDAIEQGLERATTAEDPELLRTQLDELNRLRHAVLDKQPGYHLGIFEHLAGRIDEMKRPEQAEQLVAQGRRAMQTNDLDSVKATYRQLWSLLPPDAPPVNSGPGGISGVDG